MLFFIVGVFWCFFFFHFKKHPKDGLQRGTNLWTLSGVQMHYIAYVIAHMITRTFSLAFEKGNTGKVQNYV